jgi:hypothetical protein
MKITVELKAIRRIAGIIAIAAIIGFTMSACGGDDSGGGGNLGDNEPVITGNVFTINETNDNVEFNAYTGEDLTVSCWELNETGEIKNGKLSFPLGTPKASTLTNIIDFIGEKEGVTFSSDTVNACIIFRFSIENSNEYDGLERINIVQTLTSYTLEQMQYVYVDENVNVSGREIKYDEYTEDGYTYKDIDKAYNHSFKKGWNTLYIKVQGSLSGSTVTTTVTQALSNPSSLKWCLSGYGKDSGDGGYSIMMNKSMSAGYKFTNKLFKK